jgi:hypothetical protein
MSFRDIAALLRRQAVAVLAVVVMALGVGYNIKAAPPYYSQSASVIFSVTRHLAMLNGYGSLTRSLTATETMMAQVLTSATLQDQVRQAGGIAQFTVIPFNLSNLQYPDYAAPVATLTATSPTLAAVRRTFSLVTRYISHRLAQLQAASGVPRRDRIVTYLAGKTGAGPQPGSQARVLAGLVLITTIAAFSLANLLDRRGRVLSVPRWLAAAAGPPPRRRPRR